MGKHAGLSGRQAANILFTSLYIHLITRYLIHKSDNSILTYNIQFNLPINLLINFKCVAEMRQDMLRESGYSGADVDRR